MSRAWASGESLVAAGEAAPGEIRVAPAPCIDALAAEGRPLRVAINSLTEDTDNPRTEFPDEEIAELAADIALRGILQPVVVRPRAHDGTYPVLFGAKRLRAAKLAGLETVPVVLGSEGHGA